MHFFLSVQCASQTGGSACESRMLYVQFVPNRHFVLCVVVKRVRWCCRWVPLMRSGHNVSFRAQPVDGRGWCIV